MILKDWLGEGGEPVMHRKAEERALVCIGCAENRDKFWWESAKSALATAIKWHLSVKNRMNLNIPHEKELGVCAVCKCTLPLKIWAPIGVVASHLKEKDKKKFPAICWIKNEMEAQ